MSRRHRPRKRFGQHFLADRAVVRRIVRAAAVRAGETLIEIGPGHGVLSDALLEAGAQLELIEIDRDLCAELAARYAPEPRVRLHCADALRFDFARLPAPLRVVGNLPYNISTPLLFRLLDCPGFAAAVFMVQREVALRLAAAPGTPDYGRLSVMVGARARVERLFDVPPAAFRPPPRVHSAVVRMTVRSAPPPAVWEALKTLVCAAFSARRKTLRNALAPWFDAAALAAAGLDPQARPETLAVTDYLALAGRLAARGV